MKKIGNVIIFVCILLVITAFGFITYINSKYMNRLESIVTNLAGKKTIKSQHAPLTEQKISKLIDGGFIIYIRHSKREKIDTLPAYDVATLIDEIDPVRSEGFCLSEQGQNDAKMLGRYLLYLKIPIGEVISSPICRARETAEYAFGRVDRVEPILNYQHFRQTKKDSNIRDLIKKKALELFRYNETGKNKILTGHGNYLRHIGINDSSLVESGMFVIDGSGDAPVVIAESDLRNLANIVYQRIWKTTQ